MGERTCSVDDCPRPVAARGLCSTHYGRARLRGELPSLPSRQLECPICRKMFDTTHSRKRACSPECNSVAQNRKKGNQVNGQKRCRTCTRVLRRAAFDLRARSCRQCQSLRREGRKRCHGCEKILPHSEFYARPSRNGYTAKCKACEMERAKEFNARTETRRMRRSRALWYRYGIDLDDYNRMAEEQGNACAVCRGPSVGKGALHVDHDHSCCPSDRSCGECIRGLVCSNCNFAIGAVRDSVENARSLVAYLEASGAGHKQPALFALIARELPGQVLVKGKRMEPKDTAVTRR